MVDVECESIEAVNVRAGHDRDVVLAVAVVNARAGRDPTSRQQVSHALHGVPAVEAVDE
jgi:hypothetical protein